MKKLIRKIKMWFKVFFELVKMFDSAFCEIRFINHKIVGIEKELEEVKNRFNRGIRADNVFLNDKNFKFGKYGKNSKKYIELGNVNIERILIALLEYLNVKPKIIMEQIKIEQINEEWKLVFEKERKKNSNKYTGGKDVS